MNMFGILLKEIFLKSGWKISYLRALFLRRITVRLFKSGLYFVGLEMEQRCHGVISWYNNAVSKWLHDFLAGLTVFSPVTGLSYILIIVLLQELIVFPYRLQVYCMSIGLLWRVRYLRLFHKFVPQIIWKWNKCQNLGRKFYIKVLFLVWRKW